MKLLFIIICQIFVTKASVKSCVVNCVVLLDFLVKAGFSHGRGHIKFQLLKDAEDIGWFLM